MALMHGIGDRVNTAGMLSPALLACFDASSTLLDPERRSFAVISPKLREIGRARAIRSDAFKPLSGPPLDPKSLLDGITRQG